MILMEKDKLERELVTCACMWDSNWRINGSIWIELLRLIYRSCVKNDKDWLFLRLLCSLIAEIILSSGYGHLGKSIDYFA